MHEREFDHAQAMPDAATRDSDLAPGRSNRAAQLIAPTRPLVSGLLQRKARDSNGVADDAEHAVASASSSSGDRLPEPIMHSFESSLGADLSSVRVHTGAESQAAAGSVGARAYTIGQDIHFGAGEYNPSTTDGQRLIAHEVVHTVQQSGSAPSTQYKLAVSATGDAHETEADELAEHMIAAQPALAEHRSASPVVARKPVTQVARGIHRQAIDRHGFRRRSSLEWCKENPADPWNHGPNNYIAVGSAMPAPAGDQPGDIAPMLNGRWPEPLNGLDNKGQDYQLPPESTVERANTAIDALERVVGEVVSTHNGMAAKIRDYGTASEQVKPDGFFGPAPAGLNWGAPKNGAPLNTGQLTEKQVPADGKTSVGEVFKGSDKVQGVDEKTIAAAQQKEVSKALEDARGKDADVKKACKDYGQYIRNDIGGAAGEVAQAFLGLSINTEKVKEEDAKDKIKELEEEKKDASETVSTAGKVIEKVGKWLEGDVGATSELIQLAAEKVISGHYEPEINAQKEIIKGCRTKIRALEQSVVEIKIHVALNKLTTMIENFPDKRRAVVLALKAKQDAYDNAAKLAKQAAKAHGATGEQADRIAAAIAAIPRIEVVVAKLNAITGAGNVPAYDPVAGLAYAVGRNGNRGIDAPVFERAIGAIRGYHDRYATQQTMWQARLDSAKAVADGLNVPSSTTK